MMFRGVVLLVCILVAQSFAIDVEGIPSKVCGNQTFSTTYATTNPITFAVSSSDPKITVSPASVTYTPNAVVPITVRCGELGPAEITFRSSGANPVTDSVYIYCFGLLNVANPISSIHRGNTFELILELYPTPVQRVEVLIDSYSPLVIPGAERAIFGIEQDVANAIFYVPAGGDVGTAQIVFKSRSLRDYIGPNCQDLVFSVDVQGEIASNVSSVLANTLSYTIEVEISPPPLVETEIFIHSFDGIAPASILFAVGDKTQTFEYTVTAAAGAVGCIDFSATYYEATTYCFDVIGSITTNINTDINTFAVETFSVYLNPGASTGGVPMTITASDNIQVTSSLFFQEGDNVETFQIVGVDNMTGPGYIEFSAPGYSGLRVDLNVIQVECDYGYTISRDGTFCLECPSGLFGSVCTFSGDCVYSSFAYESARCVCYDGYFGPECEFYSGVTESGPNVLIVPFEYSGTTIVDKYIPLTVSATFTIPPGIIQDGETGEGTAYIVPVPSEADYYYYNVAVDPTYYALEIDGDEVTLLESGFVFEIAAADNTALENFRPPVLSKFVFHPLKVSQAEFLQSSLYYFDESASEWVTALSICPAQFRFTNRDLLALSYGTYLCKSGQYQFFVVAPEPYHKVVVDPQPDDAVYFEKYFIADMYLTGTGLGGEAPPLPPQPVFRDNVIAEAILDPGKLSPPKMNYLYESVSPASSLVVSVVTLFVAVLLVL